MPNSTKRIRDTADITNTPRDAGLQMTLTVKAYDTGIVEVDETVINKRLPSGGYDQGQGWLGAAEHITLKLSELRRQARARQR